MLKNLNIPSLEKVFPIIGKVLYAVALLLAFAFLLFSANQKNNHRKVGLSHSMALEDFIININEEKSLTEE